jgi:hypothetical protein
MGGETVGSGYILADTKNAAVEVASANFPELVQRGHVEADVIVGIPEIVQSFVRELNPPGICEGIEAADRVDPMWSLDAVRTGPRAHFVGACDPVNAAEPIADDIRSEFEVYRSLSSNRRSSENKTKQNPEYTLHLKSPIRFECRIWANSEKDGAQMTVAAD